MTRRLGASVLALALASSAPAFAQQSAQTPQSSGTTPTSDETLPATTTVTGTTGIWFVPTAEVLPKGKWSASLYRTNIDDGQGFADISTFPATFAVGLANRAELFGAFTTVTRIDRDTRPLFFSSDPLSNSKGSGGGILVDYPFDQVQWTGNKVGDFWVGAKVNLLATSKSPLGVAVRGMVKLPTGDKDNGVSTGKADFQFDGIVSGSNRIVEVSGVGGVIVRGNPDNYTLTNGLRWGIGAALPQRYSLGLRFTAELFGEHYFNDTITAPAGLMASDGSFVPTSTDIRSPAVVSFGLTWQAPNGFFLGAATSWNVSMGNRMDAGSPNTPKDDKGLQVRLGFHPGVRNRSYTPPPPPPPAPPAPPAPVAQNRPPTVRASCNPCTVEVGRTSTVTADAQDPDGDALTYQWTAAAGTLASPTARQSLWTAPNQPGPVPFTVTVSDGKGGTARDTVTIQVTQPVRREYTFDDVHFDFDRYTLRQESLSILDSAIAAMQADSTLRIQIEGHTDNIGTSEYNLALGQRRAQSVFDYLVSRGISADRLSTVSYGEEQPKYDNSREDTRRLNRRAALIVRLTN